MKIIFMGTPDFAVPVLEALIRAGHDICCVLTQPDRRRSRGKITFSPVKQCALDHGLTVYQPDKLKDDTDVKNALAVCRADAAVVVAYGQILKKDVLDMPRLGCFNVHASLLPKYRGAAPMQAAILNGEEETGVTIMKMGVGLDNGDMAAQARTSVGRKNFEQIHDELSAMGAQLLVDTLPLIERGEVVFVKQDDSEATYAPKLTKQDGRIDFGKSPKQIDQQVRAFDPWPGAQLEQINTTLDDYSKRLEYINCNGNREEIYNAISYNPYLQQMYGNWKFVEYDKEGNIIGERIRPLLMRQTYRSEIFLLAELCGYEVIDIYRGYKGDKEDLNDPTSAAKYKSNLIWILKKK